MPSSSSSSSRIPRTRTTTRARSALHADDDTDENRPPPLTSSSRAPSRAGKAATAAPPPPPSRRLRVAFAPLHAATGQNNTTTDNQMPTPPNSSSQTSPPRKATRSATTDKGLVVKKNPASKLPRARSAATAAAAVVGEPSSTSSNSLTVPMSSSGTSAASSTTRRRTSRSPIIAIPPGPSHAPHVLAARRRASVSPLPATFTDVSTAPAESSSKPKRKSRAAGSTARPKPRPSELLPVPLGSPPPTGAGVGGGEEDDADFDELLLLPPEMTRGRGEGKLRPPHHHHPGYRRERTRSTSRQLAAGETTRFPASQTSVAVTEEEGEEDQSIKSEQSLETATAPLQQQQQVDMSFFSITAPSSDPAAAAAAVDGDDAAREMMADSTATADGGDHDGARLSLPDGGDDPYENDMGGFDGHDDFASSFEPEPVPPAAAALPDAPFATQSVEASHHDDEAQINEQSVPALVPAAAVSVREEMDDVDVVEPEPEVDEIPQPKATMATTMMMEQPSLQFADLEEASSGSEMGDDAELEVEAVEQELPLANEAGAEEEAAADAAELLSVEEEEEELKLTEEAAHAGVAEDTAAEGGASRCFEDETSLDSHDDDDDDDDNASQDEQGEAAMNESMSSSFEFPSHSARQSRPSYPPLSPNRTGEFDEEVPVRMASSSPEPEEEAKEVEVEPVVQVQVQEEEAEPSGGKPVEVDEPDVFATAHATTSPAASLSNVAPRLQDPELEEAKPVVASTFHATFPLHGTPSSVLPALLRPSTFFPSTRSPSPAAFQSPRPLPSPASRPTLQFASPRLPRDRYPTSAFATSPAPASLTFAPESSPAKSWTRGPAFFRSSSFSPPAHAALPKTATLFERHPGGAKARMMARGEGGAMMEQSQEYQQWGAGLETSSPAPPEEADLSQRQREGDEAGSEHDSDEQSRVSDDSEEEEDAVILVGQEAHALEHAKSRSLSPASATSATAAAEIRPEGAPTAADAFAQEAAAAASSSEEGGYASPARSLSGDVRMASPSPRHSVSSDRSDPESAQKTPRDVGATAGDVDCRMASPSPARSEHVRAHGGSPLRARIGEFVEGSRSRIQGMLFGSPQSKRPSSQSGDASSALDPVKASAQQEAAAAEEAEQPFADSNHSSTSFSSHTSRRSSRRRSRPSHPTLPVIEISSTDAHAAARAAAILKMYHKYVEQGVDAVDMERLVAAEQAGAAFDASIAERSRRSSAMHAVNDDEEEEEELRTLLHDAEEEVRELVPRQSSTPAEAILSGLNTIPPPRQPTSAASVTETLPPWTSREWRRLEQALVEVGRRRLRATSAVSAASTSMSMTSEAIASASVTGEDVEPDEVIETFLRKWSIPENTLHDGWSWDKLVIRVEALQARRAKDAQSKRASSVRSRHTEALPSQPSQARTGSSRDDELESEEEEEDGAVVDDESLVKLEASDEADEDALAHDDEGGDNDSSSDEGDAEADETFFAPSRGAQYRRRRRSSIEPVHQPTALANPALRHLYEATPAPEKPRLKGLVRPLPPAPESSDDEEEDAGSLSGSGTDERSQQTPEPREAASEGNGKSPSSAQRLFSYLGSFVRRSPGASPSSSTRAAPCSSSTSSPDALSSSEEPEMKQVEQRSVALGAHTLKPLPPISDRKILPLPPSHVPVASTSKTVVAGEASFDQSATAADMTTASSSFVPFAYRRRRRSSNSGTGERSLVWDVVNAIEEAESSREEEEARIVELLQNSSSSSTSGGGVKRRAASGDLRVATSAADSRAQDKGKGEARGFVEVERELERAFVPTGTRALDRRVSGEKRATRR